MATIRKLPSGKFQAIVRLKKLKPIYKSFPTRAKAKQWAELVERDTSLARNLASKGDLSLRQAVQIESHGRVLQCVIPLFSEWAEEFLTQDTMKDQSSAGRIKFWQQQFDGKLVTDILPEDIDDILLALSTTRTGSTVNRYKSNLSSVFIAFNKHPKYKKLQFNNPVRSEFVSSFPENAPRNRFLSPNEQRTLLEAAKHSAWNKLYLLVLMALTTGARRGEILGLSWKDLDLSNRVAKLHTSKNQLPRLLPLLPSVNEELMRHRETNDSLVFRSTVDIYKPFDFKKAWMTTLRYCGLEGLRFHDLRHTAASNMVSNNKTLFETGTLLGHKQSSTTMRYAHLAHHHTSKMAEEVWKSIHGD